MTQEDRWITNWKAVMDFMTTNKRRPSKFVDSERGLRNWWEHPSKNLAVTDELIEGWLSIQKDTPMCYTVLALLYSHLNFDSQEKFHKDHLHPASYFQGLKKSDFAEEEEYAFYTNPENWNSIVNLQLLNSLLNESKLATPLDQWVKDNNINLRNQLIPDNVSLDVKDFRLFVEERKKLLAKRLKKIIKGVKE